jgi:hypothetical protein
MNPTNRVALLDERRSAKRLLPVVILLFGTGVGIGLLFVSVVGTNAQSLDTLTITTCRLDQSLYQVQIAQQFGAAGTVISGEAVTSSRLLPSRVVVVATDNLGFQRHSQGHIARGYAGVQFRAVLPIGKVFLRSVMICLD